jgi:hypothetical protein
MPFVSNAPVAQPALAPASTARLGALCSSHAVAAAAGSAHGSAPGSAPGPAPGSAAFLDFSLTSPSADSPAAAGGASSEQAPSGAGGPPVNKRPKMSHAHHDEAMAEQAARFEARLAEREAWFQAQLKASADADAAAREKLICVRAPMSPRPPPRPDCRCLAECVVSRAQKAYVEHDENRIVFRLAGGKEHKLTVGLFSRFDGKVCHPQLAVRVVFPL